MLPFHIRYIFVLVACASCMPFIPCHADPIISEFLAANGRNLEDEDGNSPDWIEIYNPNETELDLGNYFLTDDIFFLNKWRIPSNTVLPPKGFIIIFASSKNRAVQGNELHTNFSLNNKGEYLALIKPNGQTVCSEFSPVYPKQYSDVSYGYKFDETGPDLSSLGYLTTTTPGTPNDDNIFDGKVEDTKFSHDRNFYSEPFELTLSTLTEGAKILYTTDFSEPGLTGSLIVPLRGIEYDGQPILIDKTTVIRAFAYKDGFIPTNVDTHSYIFLDDAIRTSTTPPNFPGHWNNQSGAQAANYEMDPTLFGEGKQYSEQELKDSLRSHPSMLITTAIPNLFHSQTGIYSNAEKRATEGEDPRAWEREISFEVIGVLGEKNIQVNAGLRMNGKASRLPSRPKHNMRIDFREDYGTPTLNFPIFPEESIDKIDKLILRGGNGDSWINNATKRRGLYARDEFHRDLQKAQGNPSQRQTHYHLYINGLYWGIYHIFERMDGDYMKNHFGGETEDYDVMKDLFITVEERELEALDGSIDSFLEALEFATESATDLAAFQNVERLIDLDNFIDYIILNFYTGNGDWDESNWRAARRTLEGIGWQFFAWDSERTIGNSIQPNSSLYLDPPNVTNTVNPNFPTDLHQRLSQSEEYRVRFADRAYFNLYNDGPLTPEKSKAVWDIRIEEIRDSLIAESVRWGDTHADTAPTTLTHWENQLALLETNFFPNQTDNLIDQLKAIDLIPETKAPIFFNQRGGRVPDNFEVILKAGRNPLNPQPGIIYYTMDGADPRAFGSTVSETAIAFDKETPPTLTKSTIIKCRIFNDPEWSPLNEAQFLVGTLADATNLVISEIHYRPLAPSIEEQTAGFTKRSDFEFIELFNISDSSIDLTNAQFLNGVTFRFDNSDLVHVAPGQRVLIVGNQAAFAMRYGNEMPVIGQFEQSLSDNGETLSLLNDLGESIQTFEYQDSIPWPKAPDGLGFSLTLKRPKQNPDPSNYKNWRSSITVGGSPGADDAILNTTWRKEHFSEEEQASPDISGPLADPDNDGLPNRLEFALGTNPKEPSKNRLPKASVSKYMVDGSMKDFLTLTYTCKIGVDEVNIVVEVSDNLINWQRESGQTILVSPEIINPDGTKTVTIRDSSPLSGIANGNRFIRLNIE